MNTYLRPSNERGHVNMGWLNTHHTFSFGEYRDPAHMHFGPIRVLNDDVVAGGGGFPPHPHADMEILTYVLSGALAHKDSMGNGATINAGDVQIMSAGTGITHSEFNESGSEPVHLLQIWVFPQGKGLPPRYEQKTLPDIKGLLEIAVPGGSASAVDIKQDIRIHRWTGAGEIALPVSKGVFVHVVTGPVEVNGHVLRDGDAVGLTDIESLALNTAEEKAHALIFVL